MKFNATENAQRNVKPSYPVFISSSSFLSIIEFQPQPPHSCHLRLLPSKCSIISARTDVNKISWSHIAAFIKILWLYISRSQSRKKTTCGPMRKCIKSARAAHFFLTSSLLGNITLLCSSRPLIPF